VTTAVKQDIQGMRTFILLHAQSYRLT